VKNVKFVKMKKLIEIPMKHFIKKRVTVYKNGKRRFYYINKLLKELFIQEELKSNKIPSTKSLKEDPEKEDSSLSLI
jgi:hypothetical protein